jgi:hypothetical protein
MTKYLIVGLLLNTLVLPQLPGQEAAPPMENSPLHSLPLRLQPAFSQLGQRFTAPDQPAVLLSGAVKDATGTEYPVQLTWQRGGKFRIVKQGAAPQVLTFDGAQLRVSDGKVEDGETALLDTLVLDSPEQIFDEIARGNAAAQRIGGGFRITQEMKGYTGPYLDVYRLFPPLQSARRPVGQSQVKFVCLDSSTSKLYEIRHFGGTVITRFLSWAQAGSEVFPSVIVRMQDGKEVLRYTVQSVGVSAALPDSHFQ